MSVENFGVGILGGIVLVDPTTGEPYKAVGGTGEGGVSSWNDLTDKPATFPPTIGATSVTAVAGNDSRLTDTRTPTDGSVTNAKVSGSAAISADKLADGSTNVVMTAADRTKLSGIAAGATVNSSDATLLARANHTGTQAIATVTGLQTALDGKQAAGSYAAATHTHPATDITTTLDIAQVPTGTSSTTVSLGNHSHTPASIGASAVGHTHAISDVTSLQTTLDGKAAASHTHTASQVSDSTTVGRAVLTAADAAAGRTAIGAGTSNLALGTTSTTAAAGDHTHSGYAAVSHTHVVGDVTNLQTTLDGKAPLSHTHTSSQISDSTTVGRALMTAADAATALSTVGGAASSHTHAASAVTSGTLDIARVPTGTSGTTVALGNHTHSDLTALTAVLTQAATLLTAMQSGLGIAVTVPYATASGMGSRPSIPTNWPIFIEGGTTSDTDPSWMVTNDLRIAATA